MNGSDTYANASPAGTDPNGEHPQLGKVIIAAGIRLFGDSAIGWRIGAVVFGTISLLLLYWLVRCLGGSSWLALATVAIGAIENLWLVSGRIAVLDIYCVPFMLAGVAFYVRRQPVVAGILVGVGACIKEFGVYALFAILMLEALRGVRWLFWERTAAAPPGPAPAEVADGRTPPASPTLAAEAGGDGAPVTPMPPWPNTALAERSTGAGVGARLGDDALPPPASERDADALPPPSGAAGTRSGAMSPGGPPQPAAPPPTPAPVAFDVPAAPGDPPAAAIDATGAPTPEGSAASTGAAPLVVRLWRDHSVRRAAMPVVFAAVAAVTFFNLLAVLDRTVTPYHDGHPVDSGQKALCDDVWLWSGACNHFAFMNNYAADLTSPNGPQGIASYPWQFWGDVEPINYYTVTTTVRSGANVTAVNTVIAFQGLIHPVILVTAWLAILLNLWWAVRRRDDMSFFVCAWIVATWLPAELFSWRDQRTTYLYYMVVTLPALFLGIARLLALRLIPRWLVGIWVGVVISGFCILYPFRTLSGS